MRVVKAFSALINGVRAPQRIQEVTTEAAMAVFAIAVFLVAFANTWSAITEQGSPALVAESARLLPASTMSGGASAPAVDLTLPQRQFTQVLGGALQKTIIPYVVMALVAMIFLRFAANAQVGFLQCLAAISATALIDVIGIVVSTGMHVGFETTRAGLHAGVFVDPIAHPMWFLWLQSFSVATLWQFVAACIGLVTWTGLHWRYGVVIGAVVWVTTRVVLGGFALLAWIVSLGAK